METIQTTMFGGSGTGKTSILAAMYDRFNTVVGEANLQLIPSVTTTKVLGQRLGELKALCANPKLLEGSGIQGNRGVSPFSIEIRKENQTAPLTIKFIDFPGGYIDPKANEKESNSARSYLSESSTAIIAINANALMEKDGKYDEMYNYSRRISEMIQAAYKNLSSPRLILLVPVKSETYLHDQRLAIQLNQRVKSAYHDLLGYLHDKPHRDNVAVVITPVQTVGSVILDKVEQPFRRDPKFHYKLARPDATFSPQDCDQPLRYLLRFSLKIIHNERAQSWGLFSGLRQFLGLDDNLRQAIEVFTKGCKASPPFEIIQGSQLL